MHCVSGPNFLAQRDRHAVSLDFNSTTATSPHGKSRASWAATQSESSYPISALHTSLTGTFPTSYPDRVRGVLNEGGLFGERQGWHLPGFDTSKWETRALSQGIPNGAGIGFFVTTLELDVPRDADAMMSFVFDKGGTQDQDYRALLFVNGWQFGKVRRTLERAMLLSLRSLICTLLAESGKHRTAVQVPRSARHPRL